MMFDISWKIIVIILVLPTLLQCRVFREDNTYKTANELFQDLDFSTPESKLLLDIEEQHKTPYIQKVSDKIFVAVDYALGYSIWLLTKKNTIVVVDTPEGSAAAERIRNDMRARPEIGNKSIAAIVYTVFHADHTFGAKPFVLDPANNGVKPTIIAHKNMILEGQSYDTFNFFKLPRAIRVYGLALPESALVDPFVRLQLASPLRIEYYPSMFIDLSNLGQTELLTIDGLDLEFIYTPGYTTDQLSVWIPSEQTVLPADNFYEAFPNLYTLRGEPARNVLEWAASIRILINLDPKCMAPSHSKAICGKQEIKRMLETYADSIQFVHDQTIRYLAKGYTADIISDYIRLPETFRKLPYLLPIYGTPVTAVRSIIENLIGWFSGEIEDLLPPNRFSRAKNMVKYFSRKELLKVAEKACRNGDWKFCLDIATHVWLDSKKTDKEALNFRGDAAKRIAEAHVNSPIRNYLLTKIAEDWDLIENPKAKAILKVNCRNSIKSINIEGMFKIMQYHVNAALATDVDSKLLIKFLDERVYLLHVRNYILSVTDATTSTVAQDVLVVETMTTTWRNLLIGSLTAKEAAGAQVNGTPSLVVRNGGVNQIEYFLSLFDFNDEQ